MLPARYISPALEVIGPEVVMLKLRGHAEGMPTASSRMAPPDLPFADVLVSRTISVFGTRVATEPERSITPPSTDVAPLAVLIITLAKENSIREPANTISPA